MSVDVVGLGTIVVDHQVILAHHPEPDSKNEALADHLQVGGPVPTAMVLLSRFGKQCAFLGSWGDDAYGRLIEADLQRERVQIASATRKAGSRTGFAHVWIDQSTGSRTIACYRCNRPLTAADLDRKLLSQCRAIHLDGWPQEASLHAARIVKQNGGQVCLDTGSPKPGMDELIPLVDVLNCPRRFLSQFLGTDNPDQAGRELLGRGPRIVTITDGQREAALYADGERIIIPAYPISAVDTTGAGDIFCGALIYGALEGWPAERLLRFAAATAALKCTELGNRDALPEIRDIENFMAANSPA